jgi:hypothetical protein
VLAIFPAHLNLKYRDKGMIKKAVVRESCHKHKFHAKREGRVANEVMLKR